MKGVITTEKQSTLRSTTMIRDPYRLTETELAERYKLLKYAGGGGMGVVYQARNLTDQSIIAVKILKPDIVARNPEYAELFEKEVRTAQSMKHPHIVEVYDSGNHDGLSFMVMEWLEGESIEDVLVRRQLPLDSIIKIFEQICSAVSFAHENKIIHLDIKPGNILLLEDRKPEDFIKVIDFGLSRILSRESGTTVTHFRGTYQYCAPEQFGGKVSHRSDIYSLGATLYCLLTGVMPFSTSYINAKLHPNLELPEIPSVTLQRDVPCGLNYVIRKALHKNPDLRQQSAKQLFDEFHNAIFSNSADPEVVLRNEVNPAIEDTSFTSFEVVILILVMGPPFVLVFFFMVLIAFGFLASMFGPAAVEIIRSME